MALSRREFLAASSAAALWPRLLQGETGSDTPFALGIASGYPHAGGCTLWTRITKPAADAQMDPDGIPVKWEVARDEAFRDVAVAGTTRALPRWGYSVHVDIHGLDPART